MRDGLTGLLPLAALTAASCASPQESPEQQQIAGERAFAAHCSATLGGRDPAADARSAARAGDRRLLTWREGGIALFHVAPGVDACQPSGPVNVAPRGLPQLPLGHAQQACVRTDRDMRLLPCYEANQLYGAAFNREMLRIAPDAMRTSCKSPELLRVERRIADGHRPPAQAEDLQHLLRPTDFEDLDLRPGEHATVSVRLLVRPDGSTACKLVGSSGSQDLGNAICRLLRNRAKFGPATGGPWAGHRTIATRIHWRPPVRGKSGTRANRGHQPD